MAACGTAEEYVYGSVNQPDASFMVRLRNPNSVNIVQETDYHGFHNTNEGMISFHQRLTRYITGTEDVMLVVGIKVYGPLLGTNDFGAIACLYERDAHGIPVLEQNVSFGTVAIAPGDLATWNAGTNNFPITGVGVAGYPPCNQANRALLQYQLRLRQSLMLCTNAVPPFTYHPNEGPVDEFFDLELYSIQQSMQAVVEL